MENPREAGRGGVNVDQRQVREGEPPDRTPGPPDGRRRRGTPKAGGGEARSAVPAERPTNRPSTPALAKTGRRQSKGGPPKKTKTARKKAKIIPCRTQGPQEAHQTRKIAVTSRTLLNSGRERPSEAILDGRFSTAAEKPLLRR